MDVNPAQAQAYIVNPLTGRKVEFANLWSSHPPTAERVRAPAHQPDRLTAPRTGGALVASARHGGRPRRRTCSTTRRARLALWILVVVSGTWLLVRVSNLWFGGDDWFILLDRR